MGFNTTKLVGLKSSELFVSTEFCKIRKTKRVSMQKIATEPTPKVPSGHNVNFTFLAPRTHKDRASLALSNGCKFLDVDAYSVS